MKSLSPVASVLLVLSLCGASDLEAQDADTDLDGAFAEIESIRLVGHPDGVELEIMASGALNWSIRDPGDGELIVRLRDCLPGPELPEIRPDEGLVESVEVGSFGTPENPEIGVSVRTRRKIKYRVAVGERSVTVLLISREPALPAVTPEGGSRDTSPALDADVPPDVQAERPHHNRDLAPADTSTVPDPRPEIAAAEPPPEPPAEPVPAVAPPAPPPSASMSAAPPPSASAALLPETGAVVPEPFTSQAGEYRVGAGDVLAIDVFGLDEMDRKVRVQRDGKISLPLLGVFSVAGLDLEDAELLIAGMLRDKRLVREPQVSIFVEELLSRAVNVQGAVVKPGVYQLIGSKSLLEVIGEAGGIREDSGARVLVLRREAGEERKMDLDLEALVAGDNRSVNIPLLPGDIVMVPFSRRLTVYVTGAVEQPGPVSYQSSDGITVLQAIIAAGGPTPRANLKNVHILRKLPAGGQQKIKANIKKIQSGKMDDVVLERNDTVVVGEWFF